MEQLFSSIENEKTIEDILKAFSKKKGQSFIYGLSGTQKHVIVADGYRKSNGTMLIICPERESLSDWKEDLATLIPETLIVELPEVDNAEFRGAIKSKEISAQRMDILGKLVRKERLVILAKAVAIIQKEISFDEFRRRSLHLKLGDELSREALLENLVSLGYERSLEVECIGQFSVRGGIVDIFPINARMPVRVELFGDEIDSLREFEVNTKRSHANISSITVLPLAVSNESGMFEMFLSYLAKDAIIIFDEPVRIKEQIRNLEKENPELNNRIFSWNDLVKEAACKNVLYFALVLQRLTEVSPTAIYSVISKAMAPYQRQLAFLVADLKGYMEQGENIIFFMSNTEKAISIREFLVKNSISAQLCNDDSLLKKNTVNIFVGRLLSGFEIPSAHLVVITEKDILGRQKKKLFSKIISSEKIGHFRDIHVGDYVVHVNHGIGKYMGVTTLEVDGVHRDYLHVKYGGDDKLFVPTDQVQFLQKYIGAEGETPRLNRMSGGSWNKAKAKARAAVEDIAKELLELYAKRNKVDGFSFLPDTPWQREFEDAFPYEETKDQLKAIVEIKEDMEKLEPMDRLLCGDVGFGKTEVAMRAAFKAVMSGKQVAVLVPTTVLAQQHYQTFLARFNSFGPVVDVICRFRSIKEQRATIKRIEEGRVDIIIGTHALLNQKRLKFKDLGLLIVDEEQRFGVKQKEKIKSISVGVDVLTLSATPIPRTLHMSLVGARDMSIIETPPAERFPIQTYVVEANDNILSGAIKREIKRGGQVYFIYNRVDTIEYMRKRLESLVPEARIKIGHGQMNESYLEKVMVEFYEGQFDVLLATSIIENGLDVANANTIIVYNADCFGLSQLYQMRGRVGRSSRMAFAYFMYQQDKIISETAEKRLQALKDFAEFGAGFKIAMRDLEIRGAGNLLGSQQHGHIASVGFEMYSKMLEETVQALKSGKPIEETLDPVIEIPIEAYLDGGYIEDAMHKIEIYQRLAVVRTELQINELLDELIDRFGEPTEPVLNLIEFVRIKNYARSLGIKSLIVKENLMEISFLPRTNINPLSLPKLAEFYKEALRFFQNQSMLRIKLSPYLKKDILRFVLHILKMLNGEN